MANLPFLSLSLSLLQLVPNGRLLQLDTSHAINICHKNYSYAYIIIAGIMSEHR